MRSQRLIFLLCLALSIAVHAALFETARRYGFGGGEAAAPPRKTQKHTAELTILPPQPKSEDVFGEANGVGNSVNSSEADQIPKSPLTGPDQAALTRDPTSLGPVAMAPPPRPLSQPLVSPPPTGLPTPPTQEPSKAPAFRKPSKPSPESPKQPQEQLKPQEPTPPTPPSQSQTANAGGRPLPHSDADSDPFARETAAEFTRGKVVAQSGRRFKFANPRVNLASMVEAAEIAFPAQLVLRISIDADGHVRRASIGRSTGSPSIDRAFLLSCYDSWFEPLKDSNGKLIRQDFEFPITVR